MANESDALSRALGAKGAMGRRKVTRLLNSLAAGFLDEEKYPHSSKASKHDDQQRAFFKSVGYSFFDSRLQLVGERGNDDDDDNNDEPRVDRSGAHESKEGGAL